VVDVPAESSPPGENQGGTAGLCLVPGKLG
jgi:hypothetical protein